MKGVSTQQKSGKKGGALKFTIDCTNLQKEKLIDPSSFETFLCQNIKVAGKTANLGDKVSVSREKGKVHIVSHVPMKKRYLKFLGNRYLHKQTLRDYIRIVSVNPGVYELRFYNRPEEAAE